LFSGSPRGAHASATLFSLIETAKVNGLEPYRYLSYTFTKLPLAMTQHDYQCMIQYHRVSGAETPDHMNGRCGRRTGMRKKVAVNGAGLAGLSTGCYLQMNGYDTKAL